MLGQQVSLTSIQCRIGDILTLGMTAWDCVRTTTKSVCREPERFDLSGVSSRTYRLGGFVYGLAKWWKWASCAS